MELASQRGATTVGEPMRRCTITLAARRLILALCAAAVCGCGPGSEPSERAGEDVAAGASAGQHEASGRVVERVSTARVERGEIRSVITTSGSIVARRSTPIGSAVSGRILHIFVYVGDEVPMGAPLFQIDPEPYVIAQSEAEAGLALARAQLDEAAEESGRLTELAGKEIVSSQEHRRARTRRAVARARLEQAKAHLAAAARNLNRTLVLAPYAGSIVERRVHEGTMATAQPNTTVVVLQESGVLEAVLDVPEAAQVPVQVGDRARLWVEGQVEPARAEVRAVKREIDRRTRTYAVHVPIADASGEIKSGAFVRAEIESRPRENALLVRRSAVARREGAASLLLVRDGRAVRQTVRLGVEGPEAIEILGGVDEGAEVVVGEAASRLMDGTLVRTGPAAPDTSRVAAPGAPRVAAGTLAEERSAERAREATP